MDTRKNIRWATTYRNRELIQRAKAGDRAAISELITLYYDVIRLKVSNKSRLHLPFYMTHQRTIDELTHEFIIRYFYTRQQNGFTGLQQYNNLKRLRRHITIWIHYIILQLRDQEFRWQRFIIEPAISNTVANRFTSDPKLKGFIRMVTQVELQFLQQLKEPQSTRRKTQRNHRDRRLLRGLGAGKPSLLLCERRMSSTELADLMKKLNDRYPLIKPLKPRMVKDIKTRFLGQVLDSVYGQKDTL